MRNTRTFGMALAAGGALAAAFYLYWRRQTRIDARVAAPAEGIAGAVAVGARRASGSAARPSRWRGRVVPGRFTGDAGGGGSSVDTDMGRGGTSTPTGDLAGGGSPRSLVDFGEGTVTDRDAIPHGGAGETTDKVTGARGSRRDADIGTSQPAGRSAIDMVPGVPAGSSNVDHERAEKKPEGNGPGTPDPDTVARQDRERTTL